MDTGEGPDAAGRYTAIDEALVDLRHFLTIADPGGRKVPAARYDLAFYTMVAASSDKSLGKNEALDLIKAANDSEAKVLPILRAREKAKSDSKAWCNLFLATSQASEKSQDDFLLALVHEHQKISMNQIARSQNTHESITAEQAVKKSTEKEAARQSMRADVSSIIDPSSLGCWSRVLFKEAVRIVDPSGLGHFQHLSDAMSYLRSTPPPHGSEGWTLVLQPGEYECRGIQMSDGSGERHVQLLGNRSPTITGPEGPMAWTIPVMRPRLVGPEGPLAWVIFELCSTEPQV